MVRWEFLFRNSQTSRTALEATSRQNVEEYRLLKIKHRSFEGVVVARKWKIALIKNYMILNTEQ